ncbi:MAG: hypothetical protein CMG80_04220 [Marinobacter sp.]|nr:hypothetical protein [Marinobacter sp.]
MQNQFGLRLLLGMWKFQEDQFQQTDYNLLGFYSNQEDRVRRVARPYSYLYYLQDINMLYKKMKI